MYRRCRICNAWFTEDSIKHYCQCNALKRLAHYFLDIPLVCNKRQLFVLESEDKILVGKRAVHLYASKKAFDSCRHCGDWNIFQDKYKSALFALYSKRLCLSLIDKKSLFKPCPFGQHENFSIVEIGGASL